MVAIFKPFLKRKFFNLLTNKYYRDKNIIASYLVLNRSKFLAFGELF